MGRVAPAETPFGRDIGYEVRASPGLENGGDPGGDPGHVQLGESHGPCKYHFQINADPGGVHMADGAPSPQREQKISGCWTG